MHLNNYLQTKKINNKSILVVLAKRVIRSPHYCLVRTDKSSFEFCYKNSDAQETRVRKQL